MGMFTDLIQEEFTYKIKNHSTDLSLVGESEVERGNKRYWRKADCQTHVVLVHDTASEVPTCRVCALNAKVEKLKINGIKVIDKLQNRKLSVILKCGHQKEDSYLGLLTKPFCKQCRDNTLIKKYEDNGVKVLELGSATKKTTIEFNCGHISQRKTYSDDVPTCLECKNTELTDILNKTGATKVSGGFILKCGHLAKTETYERLLKYTCLHCRNEEQIAKFEKKGLKFISNNGSHERFYELPCGHTKSLRTTQSNKNIICAICNETYYNKPSDLYLLILFTKSGGYLKLGMSNDLIERIADYKLKNTKVMILSQVQIDTAARCVAIEKALHKKYKEFRVSSTVMKQFMDCGFTECYDISIMSKLQNELTSVRKESYADDTKRYKNNE